MDHAAFPLGEGGRAQRGRMRSFPWRTANPAGWGRSFGAVRTCRFQRGRTSSPARKLWCLPLGLREPAVPIAGCCAAARELAFSFPFLMFCCVAPGLPPGPAQGLTPPLHPRKGFHPLTRFRWRDPCSCANLPFPSRDAGHPARKLAFFVFLFDALLCCAWAAAQTCAGANAAPAPAQGVSPLDPFSLARLPGGDRICRFHRGMRCIPPGNLLGCIGNAWAAATSLRRG